MSFIIYIKKQFIEHYLIIVLALLLALLVLFPVIAFPFAAKDSYKGINIAHFGTDAHYYLTRGKEVLDGNGLGNLVLREEKDKPDVFFMYIEKLMLGPIRILGLNDYVDIVTLYHFFNFFGVFLIILLIYAMVLQLSGDKKLAILSAIFVVGGYHIVYNKTLFYSDFNIYGRTTIPLFASFFFFLYLNFLLKALRVGRRLFVIMAGFLFGLLFYIYFFAWTFALALNSVLFLLYLLSKDKIKLKIMASILFMGILLGLYNVVQMFIFFGSEAGKLSQYFQWSSHTHFPIFSKIGAGTLLLFISLFLLKKEDKNRLFVLGIILAGWLALNQQVITGRTVQIGHYYWYFIVPLSVIVGFYMFWLLLLNERIRKLIFVIILVVVFVHSGVGQYQSFLTNIDGKKYEQLYAPFIEILKNDSKPGVILAADDHLEMLFTVYTPHDLFWHTAATQLNTPLDRFKDSLYIYMYLNINARDNIEAYIQHMMEDTNESSFYKELYANIEGYLSGLDYYDYMARLERNDATIQEKRQQILPNILSNYSDIARQENGAGIKKILEKYGVNYIVWDRNNHPEWDLSFLKNKKEILSENNIILYQLK